MNRIVTLWPPLLTTLLVGLILAVTGLLIQTLNILLLVLAGVLFGIFLNGVSHWIADHSPMSYHVCYGLVVVLLFGLFSAGIYYLGSQAADQAGDLWSELQSSAEQLTQRLQENRFGQRLLPKATDFEKSLGGGQLASQLMQGAQGLLWGLTCLLVILFEGLYVAFDPELYRQGLIKLVPPDRRQRADDVLKTLHETLGRWIIGQLFSMSLIGVATAIGLWLMGVPLPIPLGVLAALLTFIPNIGPVLSSVPQALLALQVGTDTVLYVIAFNMTLQTVESYLVTPLVQREQVSLPPAPTIFAQLLMGVCIGIIGVIMAAPLTAATMVLVQMLYIQERLGDSHPGAPVSELQKP